MRRSERVGRPGGSANNKYRELHGRWWRRLRLRALLVTGPMMLLGLLGSHLPGLWRWGAGALFGGALAILMDVRDTPPAYIEHWRQGADGERWTAKQLKKLDPNLWHVRHDLQSDKGNIDHLVIGPGGVFLLDSKNWFGDVTVEAGAATVTARDDPDTAWTWTKLNRTLKAASAANSTALTRMTGRREWITPVVVVWAPFEQRCVESDGVVYVKGDALTQWLNSRVPRLTPEDAKAIAAPLGS